MIHPNGGEENSRKDQRQNGREFEAEPRINHFQPWKASFRREVPASSATLQDAGPWIMEVDDAID